MNEDSVTSEKNVDIIGAIKQCLKKLLGMELNGDTRLIVKNKAFFKGIHTVLNKAEKKDIVNYLLFGQIQHLASYTTSNMRNIKARFKSIIGQPSGISARLAIAVTLQTCR